jgi:cytochrome P450
MRECLWLTCTRLAGPDTTACSERVAILYLATHADIRAKVLEEIDAADAAGQLSTPVKYEEVKKLKYFDAVIKEVFRIHPAVGNAMWRRVPKGGREWNGYFIPEGTEIGSS